MELSDLIPAHIAPSAVYAAAAKLSLVAQDQVPPSDSSDAAVRFMRSASGNLEMFKRQAAIQRLEDCKYCRMPFDPTLNHEAACQCHPAHLLLGRVTCTRCGLYLPGSVGYRQPCYVGFHRTDDEHTESEGERTERRSLCPRERAAGGKKRKLHITARRANSMAAASSSTGSAAAEHGQPANDSLPDLSLIHISEPTRPY